MKMLKLIKNTKQITLSMQRSISCTATCFDQHYRQKKGLPLNPNSFGPLTNLPDYTFLDGRITPMGSNQRKRVLRQQEVAEKIVMLNKELKFAKERYTRIQAEKAAEKERILNSKLKPKGHLLLKELKLQEKQEK